MIWTKGDHVKYFLYVFLLNCRDNRELVLKDDYVTIYVTKFASIGVERIYVGYFHALGSKYLVVCIIQIFLF